MGRGRGYLPRHFNLAVDTLTAILDKARILGHILGVVGHFISEVVILSSNMQTIP